MKTNNIENNILSFWEYVFCIIMVWSSGTLFSTDYSYMLYAMVITFFIMVIRKEVGVAKSQSPVILWVIAFMILSLFQNFIYSNGNGFDIVIKNFVIILCVFIFALSKPSHNIGRISVIVKTILIISVISNSLYIYNVFGPGLSLVESHNTETPHFYYLYTSGLNSLEIGNSFRNGGIYWEPGMYQVYLTFALLYYLYMPKVRHRLFVVLYLIISAVSTFSVTAYAVMSIIIGLYVIRNNNNVWSKLLIAIIVLVSFIIIYPYIDASMTAKQDTGSYEARSNDLFFGFKVFFNHPIFGSGIVNEEYARASGQSLGVVRNASNGMINLLISMGVVGFSIVTFYVICFAKWAKRAISPYIVLALLVWCVISTNSEPIVFHSVFEFIVGVGIAYRLSMRNKHQVAINK